MNYLAKFLFLPLIIVFYSCKGPVEPKPGIVGNWYGVSEATYPGPADEPLTAMESIGILFIKDARFTYNNLDDQNPPVQVEGNYELKGDSIILIPDDPISHRPAMNLQGAFHFELKDNSLVLKQVHPANFWQFLHDVRLTRRFPEFVFWDN